MVTILTCPSSVVTPLSYGQLSRSEINLQIHPATNLCWDYPAYETSLRIIVVKDLNPSWPYLMLKGTTNSVIVKQEICDRKEESSLFIGDQGKISNQLLQERYATKYYIINA